MSSNDTNRQTQLLSDAPANEDAFEGGHDRVAEALAGLIQDEEGGKAVALKGPFGSGKSTVVQLLENELEDVDKEEGEDTRIFTYDAWEHQGDPLRRSFIESLVEFLVEEGWAGEDEWEDEIERIARRKEETTHKTEPVLTKWGRKVALALFLSPLGLAGFAVFARGAIGEIQPPNPSWWWFGGFVGLAVIALAFFISPLFQYWRAKRNTDDDDGDPFYLFFQKTKEEKETKTIRTPDPTTIEFQEIFQDVISETLKDDRHQLIVVVDNLDRLPPEEALSTWATMRTFFETEGANEDEWMDRFWLLVPLNFEALRGVFAADERTTQNGKVDNEDDGSEERKDEDSEAADSVEAFANKTFSTVFRVAPPVLSDWEQFTKDQLGEAFEAGEPDDFHAVYRLYRIAGVEESAIPTPRDIKIFINRLSGLYRQWGGEISLPMLAAYQLKGNELSQGGQELTNSSNLKSRIKAELRDGDWQKQFAALHFNVEPDKATQVLIGDRVQAALETGNEEEDLGELSEVAGFSSVIDRAVPKIVGRRNASSMSLAALALDTVSLNADDVEDSAWRKLRNGVRSAEDWHPKEEREGNGLLNIIRRTPGRQQEGLLKNVLGTASQVGIETSVQESPNEAERWVEGVLPLVRAFEDREELVEENFHVPEGWPTYIGVVAHLAQQQDAARLAHFFVPAESVEVDGIDTAVEEMVSEDALQPEHLDGIRLLTHIGPLSKVEWPRTSEVIRDRLTLNNNLSVEELRMHLKTALVIAAIHGCKPLKQALGDDTGRALLSHYLQEHRNSDEEIVALCVLLRVLYSADQNRGQNPGNANRGHNQFTNILSDPSEHNTVVEVVSGLVKEFGIVQNLLTASYQERTTDFIRDVIREFASKSNASALIDYNLISEFPDLIGDALQENKERFEELVCEADQNGDLSTNLDSLRQDEWLERLKRENRILDVMLILVKEKDLRLSSAFRDALLDHTKWILDQQSSPSPLWFGGWNELPEALDDSVRKSFFRSLQIQLLNKTGESLTPILSMYGGAIARSGIAADVPNPTNTVNEHFIPLLSRSNFEELNWLRDILDGQPGLASEVETDFWEAFQRRIRESYYDSSGESKDLLREIADLAGVEIEDPEEENSEDKETSQSED